MKEALKLVLEALQDYVDEYGPWREDSGAQYALRVGKEALAQPEQEPVAIDAKMDGVLRRAIVRSGKVINPPQRKEPEQEPVGINGLTEAETNATASVMGLVNTTPPQRKPLTDEEIEDIWADCPADWDDKINVLTLARAIEAAHNIFGDEK